MEPKKKNTVQNSPNALKRLQALKQHHLEAAKAKAQLKTEPKAKRPKTDSEAELIPIVLKIDDTLKLTDIYDRLNININIILKNKELTRENLSSICLELRKYCDTTTCSWIANKKDKQGDSLLHLAAKKYNANMIFLATADNFLSMDPGTRDAEGYTFLQGIYRRKNLDFFNKIVMNRRQFWVGIDARGPNNDTVLHMAARNEDIIAIGLLVGDGRADATLINGDLQKPSDISEKVEKNIEMLNDLCKSSSSSEASQKEDPNSQQSTQSVSSQEEVSGSYTPAQLVGETLTAVFQSPFVPPESSCGKFESNAPEAPDYRP